MDILDPWKNKANELGIKAPKLDALVPGPEKYVGEKTTTGKDIVQIWKLYLESSNLDHLKLIIRHNQIDLLQELAALIMTAIIK